MDQRYASRRPSPRSVAGPAKRDGPDSPFTGFAARGALVIATDTTNRQMCLEVLEKSGLRVEAVDSGVAAVVAARAKTPDIVVVDAQLRDVPARLAIAWLRSNPHLATTPIIVLNASESDKVALAALAHNIALPSPATAEMIRNSVAQIFA